MQTSPFFSMFGCQISVITLSLGGLSGYSLGKMRWHLKNPPSYRVSEGPMIKTSHLKISISSIRPALNPSTGHLFNSANCLRNKRAAWLLSPIFMDFFLHFWPCCLILFSFQDQNSRYIRWHFYEFRFFSDRSSFRSL